MFRKRRGPRQGSWHTIKNSLPHSQGVWIEPWAEEFQLAPGSTMRVLANSPEGGVIHPEIEITPELLVFWFWTGATVKVFIDDVDVSVRSFDMPVPPVS